MIKETQDKPLMGGMQLVDNPELIRVRTISNKIVEQMSWIDGSAGQYPKGREDFTGVKVVGKLLPYNTLVVQDEIGNLWKMRSIAYVDWRMRQGVLNAHALTELAHMPVLFSA